MENYTHYKNSDGTYTSPKNNKVYKSLKAFIAHIHCRPDTGGFRKINHTKLSCVFCQKECGISNIEKHQLSCFLNPANLRKCDYCGDPIKNYKSSKGTCSKSCANSFFKVGENNGNFKGSTYQYICFANHKKECIVCGEDKIVAVHHYNENHDDNRPENLVPLCPTHHQYMHSRYKTEISDIVDQYINNYKLGVG